MNSRIVSIAITIFVLAVVVPAGAIDSIYDIQYTTNPGEYPDCYPSNSEGNTVTVSGVVTAVKPIYHDFWIRGEESAWNGIFVYNDCVDCVDPVRGDSVTITAKVYENFGMTELNNVTSIDIHQSNCQSSPQIVLIDSLGTECSDHGESLEGCLVKIFKVMIVQRLDDDNVWYVQYDSADIDSCKIDLSRFSLAFNPIWAETLLCITGVVNYFQNEYEILPRSQEDIEIFPQGDVPPSTGPVDLPTGYSLSQNYPNPFNASTQVEYVLPQAGLVRLEVFNLSGQKVATLFDGHRGPGTYMARWDADVVSGVYFCQLTVGDYTAMRKMIFLK